jgi:hypothetical protein
MCLRIESSVGLLWTRQRTFRFQNECEISEQLSGYQFLKKDSVP